MVTHSLASCDIAGSTEQFWMLSLEPSPCAVALKHPTQAEGSCQAGRHPSTVGAPQAVSGDTRNPLKTLSTSEPL